MQDVSYLCCSFNCMGVNTAWFNVCLEICDSIVVYSYTRSRDKTVNERAFLDPGNDTTLSNKNTLNSRKTKIYGTFEIFLDLLMQF